MRDYLFGKYFGPASPEPDEQELFAKLSGKEEAHPTEGELRLGACEIQKALPRANG